MDVCSMLVPYIDWDKPREGGCAITAQPQRRKYSRNKGILSSVQALARVVRYLTVYARNTTVCARSVHWAGIFVMISEFTERVERVQHGAHGSRLAAQVANYVQRHLSEPISTEALARELYMSRRHLSARFHKETGETLAAFITREKMEEAKRLLRYSDKPITAIGNYLGYSSSGHFGSVFKKTFGLTPSEYREKHGK